MDLNGTLKPTLRAKTQLCKRERWKSVKMCASAKKINNTREKLQDVKTLFSMFVHLIQFEVTDGLDLGLLDEGAHVTLGLSRSSRLWTRFLRGSGEHPVDTSGDLRGEPQREAKTRGL